MDNEVSKTLNCMHEAGRILSVFRSTEVSASRPSTSAASAKSSEQRRGIASKMYFECSSERMSIEKEIEEASRKKEEK